LDQDLHLQERDWFENLLKNFMDTFTSKAEILIKANKSKVWKALTDPALVKQWLFGTEMEADWKVGGQIRYRGEWESKKYEDKGEILELDPEKKIVSTYWSGMSGLLDAPENYQKVSYILEPEAGGTKLTIIQEGNKTEESAKHSENNWKLVSEKLKSVSENL
jgi:uncharacterized protein YndB with AHSA1/START domain